MKSRDLFAFLFAVFLSFVLLIPQSVAEDWLYTVRKGDTIWGLSHKYLKNPLKFKEVQKYNGVQFDRQIPPGVTLKFPMEYLKFAPAEVSVAAINGTAFFIRRGIKEALTLEHKLVLDDILITEADSSVALTFADGSELLLGENSELVFDVQTKWGETGMVDSRMRLMKGSAEGRVNPLIGPGAHFEVQTPSAVATVRGTEFRVRVDENVIFNEVDEGTVRVQLHENKATVKQGFGLKSSPNLPLAEPKKLLPKPIFINTQDKYPGLPVTFTWQPIDGAKAYQVELFNDAEMTQLIEKATVSKHQFTLSNIELGEYSLRVRGIDADGLQGLNSSHRFTISPVPSSPEVASFDTEYLAGKAIKFKWANSEGATHYRWRLAKDRQFRSEVAQQDLTTSEQQITEGLPAGTYYWKVAAGNHNGFGRYTKPVRFDVRLPEPPVIGEMESEITSDESLLVTWGAVELATTYHWQLSSDKEFQSIIEQGKTSNTQVMLEQLPEQAVYIRVAAEGPYNTHRYSEIKEVMVVEPSDGKTAFSLGSVLLFILLL